MEIKYLGHSSFRIKGKKAVVVTDPYDEKVGYRFPKTTADIVTVSHNHSDHDNIEAIKEAVSRPAPFVVNAPGEYEISDVSIFGFPASHDATGGKERGQVTIYIIHIDDLVIAHVGDLGATPSDPVLQELNGVDVLFIPVGGGPTFGPADAVKFISQVEPKIVIPMHYALPQSSAEFKTKLKPVSDFLKEIGKEGIVETDKLTVAKESLPAEMEVVVLKQNS
jgi:L-ascorbate metabolism protein UlaG (beta-lactamase superfamily)